jgi:hypothetical protein
MNSLEGLLDGRGTTKNVLSQVDSAVRDMHFDTIINVMATQHSSKTDVIELVHRLLLWNTLLDENGNQIYEVDDKNPIQYSLLSPFVSKKIVKKAAALGTQKRKILISDLRGESAISAYRGVIFEADAIERLGSGRKFTLRKCTADWGPPQEVQLTLINTGARHAMADLDNLSVASVIGLIVVPDARNFESVDAFRVSNACILQEVPATPLPVHYETLQFQMTVGKSHPTKLKGVKRGMDKIRMDLPVPENDVTCICCSR